MRCTGRYSIKNKPIFSVLFTLDSTVNSCGRLYGGRGDGQVKHADGHCTPHSSYSEFY
jgi:hypothetical protein